MYLSLYLGIYCKKLIHLVMEAEKSRDLQYEGLRTKRADGVSPSLGWKQEEASVPAQDGQAETENSLSLSLLLYSGPQLIG